MKKRLDPKDRKAQILDAAITVAAARGGWSKLSREAVARQAACSDGLISVYFGTMVNFRRTVMRAAIKAENLSVIAQGLACGDKCAHKATPELKTRALATLAGG